MTKRYTVVLIAILSFSFIGAIQPVSGNFSVDVYIKDAYYADLDSDGYEDDIKVDMIVTLTNNYVYTDIDLYLGITLPSGIEYWFSYSFTMVKYTYTGQVGLLFDLMNTATESGWYQADAVGFAEGEQFSYMDSLVFDPPGRTEGGNVQGFVDSYEV